MAFFSGSSGMKIKISKKIVADVFFAGNFGFKLLAISWHHFVCKMEIPLLLLSALFSLLSFPL